MPGLDPATSKKVDGMEGEPMWKRADDRFFWNKFLMSRMIEQTSLGGAENDVSSLSAKVMACLADTVYHIAWAVEPLHLAGTLWL